MLTLEALTNSAEDVRLSRCTLRICGRTLRDQAEWECWLRRDYIDRARQRAAKVDAGDRERLVDRAREHAKRIRAHSREAAAALGRVDGQLAFACLSLRREHPGLTTDALASMLASIDELGELVRRIHELEADRAPTIDTKKPVSDAPIDYAVLAHAFGETYGLGPNEVALLTMSQIAGMTRGMNGETETVHPNGQRMRRFRTREEAAAFIAERRAERTAAKA